MDPMLATVSLLVATRVAFPCSYCGDTLSSDMIIYVGIVQLGRSLRCTCCSLYVTGNPFVSSRSEIYLSHRIHVQSQQKIRGIFKAFVLQWRLHSWRNVPQYFAFLGDTHVK